MAFQRVFESGPIPQGDWSFYFQGQGYQVDGITNEFYWTGYEIIELDQETAEEVWRWNVFDYFSMNLHNLNML